MTITAHAKKRIKQRNIPEWAIKRAFYKGKKKWAHRGRELREAWPVRLVVDGEHIITAYSLIGGKS